MSRMKKLIGDAYQILYAVGDRLTFRRHVDFSTWVTQEEAGFDIKCGNQYQPSSIPSLKRALRFYQIRENDALIDIGCGKGKVMCVCARYPFRLVRGLELSASLAEIARQNFRALALKQCEVVVGDAQNYSDYDAFDYFYMFNPFPEDVFRSVLKNIAASLERSPRKAVLIYMNPVYHELVEGETAFRLRHVVKAAFFWFSCYCYEYEVPGGQSGS